MGMVKARRRPARLLRTGSVLVLGGLVSGCAGDVMRFSDDFYTGAVPTRPPAAVQTPFPENAPLITAPAETPTTATASRPLPQAQPSVVTQEIERHAELDPIITAATTPAPRTASRAAGWTGAGGTYVTLTSGETLYNLSRRYGVPVDALTRVNGLSDAGAVRAGQRILIPTYIHGRSVPVSAPDADAGVRAARSSVGGRSDVALERAPMPAARPVASAARVPAAIPDRSVPAAPAEGGRYTVRAGDTLSAISRRTGASMEAIRRTNALTADVVRIGQTLIIPGLAGTPASMAAVADADVDPIVTGAVTPASRPPEPAATAAPSVRALDETSTARAPDATGVATMRWPARGRVISAFGGNSGGRPNDGIDISVPKGTAVKAAENGVVIYAGDGLKEFGNTVLVRHSDGYVTVYGHLDAIDVARGDTVGRGQTLGASGMTGNARQPQLHFEVRKDTVPVDPVRYLN